MVRLCSKLLEDTENILLFKFYKLLFKHSNWIWLSESKWNHKWFRENQCFSPPKFQWVLGSYSTGKCVSSAGYLSLCSWSSSQMLFLKPVYSGKCNTLNLIFLLHFVKLEHTSVHLYIQGSHEEEIMKSIQWNEVLLSVEPKFKGTWPLFIINLAQGTI